MSTEFSTNVDIASLPLLLDLVTTKCCGRLQRVDLDSVTRQAEALEPDQECQLSISTTMGPLVVKILCDDIREVNLTLAGDPVLIGCITQAIDEFLA